MSTFIERHGYIKHPLPGYQRSGPCEIPGCEQSRLSYPVVSFRHEIRRYQQEGSWYGQIWFRDPAYVLDHCHKHGWIRGVICQTCNNQMKEYDRHGYLPPLANEFDSVATDTYEHSDYYGIIATMDTDRAVKAVRLTEYARNCPECSGLPAPKQDGRKGLTFNTPRECPACHGSGIEPRPVCLYFNDAETPCDTESAETTCSRCGPEMDKVCGRCEGSGRAVWVNGTCQSCRKRTWIYDETEQWCRVCYVSELDALSEAEYQ